ncbi:nucleolar complex protein 4 homolog B [Neocloeon triangulifer]|uniref:nucleolar complex protein 4 homolog B n=1 Tax=Neocloeon triangulifer TaxID=2078957 RepID=UPI00286F365F|nr:nucleolar complex protein 4 homolog B [Neocloeon triangulifer]XP_059470208.1 nucleolar complex protein 4 homolog B [Neocloeon triangulifer]
MLSEMNTSEIFKLSEDFIESRKNSNNLSTIVDLLSTQEGKLLNCCILSLQTMFTHSLLETKSIVTTEAGGKYREWILKNYEEAMPILLTIIKSIKHPYSVREQAMVTYVNLLKIETLHVNKPQNDAFCLPKLKYYNLLKVLVASKKTKAVKNKVQTKLISRFSEFTAMPDVALQTWVSCVTLTKCDKKLPDEGKMRNILHLLDKTMIPKGMSKEENSEEPFVSKKVHDLPRKAVGKKLTRAVDGVWENMKKWHHNEGTMHETLLLLIEKMMDSMSKPKLLTDFFMASLDYGGALSLLSLQGVFNLIQKHNIEYPDIYSKLYSLFTPEMLRTRYKQRLFYLSDLFLTSTHIPEALVAAFAKRLGRLSLTASATDILIMIPFIGNLLIRHKGIQKMIHSIEGGYVEVDPFVESETDPCKSRAIESCFWELKSLQSHLVPPVAIAARFIDEKLPTVEWDLADVLEIKYGDVFEKEMNKKAKEITLNFIPPTSEVLEKLKRNF